MLNWDVSTELVSWHGLLADPANPAHMWAFCQREAFGDNQVFRSEDYGATWTRVDAGTMTGDAWGVACDPNPNRVTEWPALYTPNGYGSLSIYRSTDGGATWTNLFPTPTAVPRTSGGTFSLPLDTNGIRTDFYQVHVCRDDSAHLLVTYHYGNDVVPIQPLLESVDGGATWELHDIPWGNSHYVYAVDSDTWLVISGQSTGGGIYRTTTAGRVAGVIDVDAWTQVHTDEHRHGSFTPWYDAANGFLYFPCEGGVQRSGDGGATWTEIYGSPVSSLVATPNTVWGTLLGSSLWLEGDVDASVSLSSATPPTGWGGGGPAPYSGVSVFDGTRHVVVMATKVNDPPTLNGEIWRYLEP
jgi:hypothetical protein